MAQPIRPETPLTHPSTSGDMDELILTISLISLQFVARQSLISPQFVARHYETTDPLPKRLPNKRRRVASAQVHFPAAAMPSPACERRPFGPGAVLARRSPSPPQPSNLAHHKAPPWLWRSSAARLAREDCLSTEPRGRSPASAEVRWPLCSPVAQAPRRPS